MSDKSDIKEFLEVLKFSVTFPIFIVSYIIGMIVYAIYDGFTDGY